MTPESPAAKCPVCGGAMPRGAGARCPACLLRGGFQEAETVKSPPAKGWPAPSVEELAPLFPAMEVLELIGRGGMGAVYKARQRALDRLVAIKVLPPEGQDNPEFGERFLREAQALAGLNHPNIVGLHDFGRTVRGHWFFIMEYVDGVDLARMMRSERLKPAAALALIPQICDALACAHEAGFIHRDIKPANILVDKKGRAKVADFGLAKLAHPGTNDFTLTGEGAVLGTPRYMAPEQMDHPLEVDHRADIYALGVVFYEMLTGEVPQGRFAPPSEKSGVDPRLDEVVLRAMDREPSRRFQHVSEIKSGIEQAVRPRGVLYRWRWPLSGAALVAAGLTLWLWPWRNQVGPAPPPPLRSNSLGQKFAPVPGAGVEFCIWETRVRDWEAFCQATGRRAEGAPFAQGPDHPAVRVSADEATAFCEWLTARERRDGSLAADEFYRLPTDAEWSAAAGLPPESGATPEEKHNRRRGMYPWGDRAPAPQGAGNYPDSALRAVQDGVTVIAAYYDGFARTAPAGSFPANAFGLHDLGGNVWEFTGTPFSEKERHPVLRGGSWWPLEHDETWSGLLSAWRRSDLEAATAAADCGFRVVIAKRQGEHRTRDLFTACREDQAEELGALLKAGADPLEKDSDDRTPLITAARHGALNCIRVLLEESVPVDGEDKIGNTALFHAIDSRQAPAALLLLEKGASVKHRTISSRTPLHAAAVIGAEELMEKFIAKGAEVDAEDFMGSTPLMFATYAADPAAVACLLRHKASAAHRNKNGLGMLHNTALKPQTEVLRLLLDAGAELDATDSDGISALEYMAMVGEAELVDFMLARGAKVSLTTLGLSIFPGRVDLFDKVLAKLNPGAGELAKVDLLYLAATNAGEYFSSLNRTTKGGPAFDQIIHIYRDRMSMREGRDSRAMVRRLFRLGVPVDNPVPGAMTALIRAAQGGLINVMEELLAKGADKDRADSAGFTPLLSAAEQSRTEAVKLLLERGAWAEARTKDQRTALHIAAGGPSVELVRLLLAKGADTEAREHNGQTPLMFAVMKGRLETVRALLDAGALTNVYVPDQSHWAAGMGPLHVAAAGRRIAEMGDEFSRRKFSDSYKPLGPPPGPAEDFLSIIRLLLERGVDVNSAQAGGITPLMSAAKTGNAAAVKLLLEHKAAVNYGTVLFVTALHHAAQAGSVECLKLLLDAGAKTDPLPEVKMQTALHWAVNGDSAEAVQILAKEKAALDARDARLATPLHWAAMLGKVDVLTALLEAGADIEVHDLGHSRPLHLAAAAGQSECVKELIKRGARLTPRNMELCTPADAARRAGKTEALDLIEQEIRRRASQGQQ